MKLSSSPLRKVSPPVKEIRVAELGLRDPTEATFHFFGDSFMQLSLRSVALGLGTFLSAPVFAGSLTLNCASQDTLAEPYLGFRFVLTGAPGRPALPAQNVQVKALTSASYGSEEVPSVKGIKGCLNPQIENRGDAYSFSCAEGGVRGELYLLASYGLAYGSISADEPLPLEFPLDEPLSTKYNFVCNLNP